MECVEVIEGSTCPPEVKPGRTTFGWATSDLVPAIEVPEITNFGVPQGNTSTGYSLAEMLSKRRFRSPSYWQNWQEGNLGLSSDATSGWESVIEASTKGFAETSVANDMRLLLWDTVRTDPISTCLVTFAGNDDLSIAAMFAGWSERQTSDPFVDYFRRLIDKEKTSDDLLSGYADYDAANWDGYNAEPIRSETVAAARFFLRLFPRSLGQPEVSPGSDGTIGLEWVRDTGPFRKLFIDIGPGNIWHAYWRLTDGRTGTLRNYRVDDTTKEVFEEIVSKLSA